MRNLLTSFFTRRSANNSPSKRRSNDNPSPKNSQKFDMVNQEDLPEEQDKKEYGPGPQSEPQSQPKATFISKKDRIKHIFVKWSTDAPFQCYPKIFESRRITLKAIWMILFIFLTCLTGIILTKNITEYLERQVVSQIEVINEITPEFPCVTVCDTNMFPTKFSENLIKNIAKDTYGLDLNDFVFTAESFEKLKRVILLAKLNVTNPSYPLKDRQQLGLKLEQILRFSYDNQIYCNNEKNLNEYFRWVFDFEYGSCFQFNSGYKADGNRANVKRVEVQGPNYGLKLFISDLTYKNRFPTAESNGFKVFIHNKTLMPRPENEIHIMKGKWTSISVKRTLIQKYPYPYSECIDTTDIATLNQMKHQSDFFNFTLNNSYTRTYRQEDCFDFCLQHMIETLCKCSYPKYFQMDMSLKVCSSLADLECILEQKENSIHVKDSQCFHKCPMECDSYIYETLVTSSDYPTNEYFNLFNKTNSNSKNELALNIYFPLTKLTRITEVPKVSLFDLFSNVGGSMGIFLGFTIFSIIDFLEVFFKIILVILKKETKQ